MPAVLRVLVPLLLALTAVGLAVSGRSPESGGTYLPGTERAGRVVLLVVDSLTDELAEDPELFPTLAALRKRALWGRMAGCLPASTVPCTRTILEGSSAGYIAGLSNFSATSAAEGSFPVLAAKQGLRIAVASDHTLVNMCKGLGGPRLHYAGTPVFRWDEAAVERVTEWMRSDAADVYLVHLVDLDKVSHAAGPGTKLYREQALEADHAIGAIAALLSPKDSLIVVGDHGHDEFGSHTPNPGYLALGPSFVPGRVDLRQPTTALLLSVAAATPLPASYEGEIPERALSAPFGGTPETQARVAARIEAQREEHRSGVSGRIWRFLPGLGLALVALILAAVERGRRLLALVAALAAAGVSVLLGMEWSIYGRPLLWFGPFRNLGHYVGVIVAFVVLTAFALGKLSPLGRAARVGIALLAFPLVVPLVGEDYFGSPAGLARLFVPALALLVLPELTQRSRWALAAVGAGAAAVALMFVPVPNGEGWLPSLGAALAGAVVIARCSEPARRFRTAVGTMALLVALGAVMDFGARATLVLALLAVATTCFSRSWVHRESLALSLVGATAVFLGYWSGLQGFRFDKVRFDFVFDLLPPLGNEAVLALIATVLTSAKYALVPWVIVAATPSLASTKHAPRVAGWLLLTVLLHAGWIAGALLDSGSRYYEFGIQTACLVAALALFSVIVLALRRQSAARGGEAVAVWVGRSAGDETRP